MAGSLQYQGLHSTQPVSPSSAGTTATVAEASATSPRGAMSHGHLRQHSRSASRDADDDDAGEDGANNGSSSPSNEPSRKRRRSRRGLDKRFECKAEGCGKSYSRAEHLYRHQLNHDSKQVFQCTFADCTRTFVRGDLLKRHMDRHAAKGSQLNRRDSVINHVAQVATHGPTSPHLVRAAPGFESSQPSHSQFPLGQENNTAAFSPVTDTPSHYHHSSNHHQHESMYGGPPTQAPIMSSPVTHSRPSLQTSMNAYDVLSPVSTQHGYVGHAVNTPQSATFVHQHNVVPYNLPPAQYTHHPSSAQDSGPISVSTPIEYDDASPLHADEMMILDSISLHGAGPVFGGDGISSKSPTAAMPHDFITYLFNTDHNSGQASTESFKTDYTDVRNAGYYPGSYPGPDMTGLGAFHSAPQSIMAVNNLLDQNVPEAAISDEKSQEMFDYIKESFHERHRKPSERQRDSILGGNRHDDTHMLSKRMMQAYIGSYWYHFSDQMPILHKPTFQPNKAPTLLLLAMMTIGAACLDRTHGTEVTQAGARLSNFLAWSLRWEIYMVPSAMPPAKLWVFQTLILLELYEKMFATRELHERAHIHHATTITLMRRGRSLIGKSAMDSPAAQGSRQSSTSGTMMSPEEWWKDWVTYEATRRVAFAAFIIDSIHATMFGHSAYMLAHEMRLPLPCDESLWKATSSSEVGRIESRFGSQGIKPLPFIEGLKNLLSNKEVRTNSFGRTILMAGLMSVKWHMRQRDVSINSLGNDVMEKIGGREKWRSTLMRAYEWWKTDFDKALAKSEPSSDPYRYEEDKAKEHLLVFETCTVLHHLAHMTMHADIVDCQMFARAKRLLGRPVGHPEFSSAQRRIKRDWAPTAKARDAMYYALKFLKSVLVTDEHGSLQRGIYQRQGDYEARDDVLLNRPWVMYFATLIIWCYGFAMNGPCPQVPIPAGLNEARQQMRTYLQRYGNLAEPNQLQTMEGINQNTALLFVLRHSFRNTRWELLHEGANLLNNCILLNSGEMVP